MNQELGSELIKLFSEVSSGLNYVASGQNQIAISLKELSNNIFVLDKEINEENREFYSKLQEQNRELVSKIHEQELLLQKIGFSLDNILVTFKPVIDAIRDSYNSLSIIKEEHKSFISNREKLFEKIEKGVTSSVCGSVMEIIDKKLDEKIKYVRILVYVIVAQVAIIGTLVGATEVFKLFLP